MSIEQWLIWILPAAGTALAGVAAFFAKVAFPAWRDERERQRDHERRMAEQEVEEQAKQREHERAQAEAAAAARQSEEVALWGQMVQLQSKVSDQSALLVDFLMTLATTGNKEIQEVLAENLKDIEGKWAEARYESRELRTQVGILVNLAQTDEEHRRTLAQIPTYLLEFQARQSEFYERLLAKLGADEAGNDR